MKAPDKIAIEWNGDDYFVLSEDGESIPIDLVAHEMVRRYNRYPDIVQRNAELLAALVEARDTMEPFIEFAKSRLANPQGLPVIFAYNGVQITSDMLLKITESYDKINELLE